MTESLEGLLHVKVVCALIERGDHVLAAKRGTGKTRAGRWEFPGGKLLEGESAEEALMRELREELDCAVRPLRPLPRVEHRYPDLAVSLLPFVCVVEQGMPRACEHAELRWIDASDFRSLDWSEADLPIALAYFAGRR